MNGNKNKNLQGFTLIELLVVIAIIALLSSIALIALMQARAKSRDAKRLSDMTQMNTALELYFTGNRGYPSTTASMVPTVIATIPQAPQPPDGICDSLTHSGAAVGIPANTYVYAPSGTPQTINGNVVYPDYEYYFCLGNQTGNFLGGERIVTPHGVK